MNNPDSAANLYIRSVTASGLQWDGQSVGDMQIVSNNIGNATIGDILLNSRVPDVGQLVSNDIGNAISNNNQTIGGWGGSFYFWNLPYTDQGGVTNTVGNRILSNPSDFEKFLYVNAKALNEQGASGFLSNLGTGLNAQVPASIAAEILGRAVSGNFFGNPNIIQDGLTTFWTRDANGHWSYSVAAGEGQSIDIDATPAQDSIFEQRRQIRINEQQSLGNSGQQLNLNNDPSQGLLTFGFNDVTNGLSNSSFTPLSDPGYVSIILSYAGSTGAQDNGSNVLVSPTFDGISDYLNTNQMPEQYRALNRCRDSALLQGR